MAEMKLIGIDERAYAEDREGPVVIEKGKDFSNEDAIEKLIRYITRTREKETRKSSLVGFGALGVIDYGSIDALIQQLKMVHKACFGSDADGRKIYHFIYSFSDLEQMMLQRNYQLIYQIGYRQGEWFYSNGYQTVFAVHDEPEKHVHIHFAVNAVSYINGKKLHFSFAGKRSVIDPAMHRIAGNTYIQFMQQIYLRNGGF